MVKNLINFFIAIGFLLPYLLSLTIKLLQPLKPKLHITNTEL